MRKKVAKADRIMAAYSRAFVGAAGEYRELVDTLVEWKENGMKEERFFICTPFELHARPDTESPSMYVSVRDKEWKLETVAEVFFDGSEWDFWCEERLPSLRWRLNNIVWLWNHSNVEEML